MPDRIDTIIMPKLAELVERVRLLEKNLEDIKETLDSISKLAYKVNSLGFRIDKLEGIATTTSFVAKNIVGEIEQPKGEIVVGKITTAKPKKARKKKE